MNKREFDELYERLRSIRQPDPIGLTLAKEPIRCPECRLRKHHIYMLVNHPERLAGVKTIMCYCPNCGAVTDLKETT